MRYAGLAAVAAAGATALGQQAPQPRGSADAVTSSQTIAGNATAQTQPALPAGHPGIGAMPAGHPALGDLPAGHPTVPGGPDLGGMPAGHPAVPGLDKAKVGALKLVVTQGTPGAAAIGADPVKVELYSHGTILKTYQSRLDAKGQLELHDLPLDTPFQPVVTVTHGGVIEQLVGPPMNAFQAAIEMDMPVYEATAEKPAWTIGILHAVAETVALPDGRAALQVTEMIGGHNPLEKAWTGTIDASGRPVTLAVPLPEGATDVILGPGLLEAGAKVENNTIVRRTAMLPGSNAYVLQYKLPAKDGQETLTFATPADVTLLAIYVPGDVKVVHATGLEPGTAQGTNGEDGMLLYKAHNVKAGSTPALALSGIKAPPPAATLPAGHPIVGGGE